MKTINERIDYLVENFSEGSNTKFARMIKSNEANVRNYRKNVQPNIEIVKEISRKFEIRYEWILEGKEPMLQNKEEKMENETFIHEDPMFYLNKDRHISALEDHIETLKNIISELKEELNLQKKRLAEKEKRRL